MWPLLLDLNKDECRRMLRKLELEAYSGIVSAFRAQGDLTKDKKKCLMDLCTHLGVSPERHKAEVRRAVNDEKLATIADQISGSSVSSEWALEGRRLVPLMPRLVPQTAFTAIADSTASLIGAQNSMLPSPSATSNAGGAHRLTEEFSKPQPTSQNSLNESPAAAVESVPAKSGVQGLNGNLQNIPPAKLGLQSQGKEQSNMGSPNSNSVVMLTSGMSIHLAGTGSNSAALEKPSRRKRSASVDIQGIVSKANTLPSNTSSTKVTSQSSSTSPRTVTIPNSGSPVQFTLTTSSQKSTSTTSTTGSIPQKVILVSTSCSSLPSSLLQRSVGVPIVKTVTTTSTTVTLPQFQPYSKTTSVMPISSQSGGIMTIANSASASSSTTVGGIVPKSTISVSTSPVPQSKLPGRQRVKQGILVPVVTQASPSGTTASSKTIQIKPGTKPSFHIKEGSGLKIIAQTVPVASGAKVLAKSSGNSGGPPIVVVTKTASLASGAQGARVVNVLTTQAGGKVITPTSLTLSKASGGGPTFVAVGQKGKQAALVKVSPNMSLASSGGKPNVIVVQKAHMLQHNSEGNANVVAFSAASSLQSTHKMNLPFIHETKVKGTKQQLGLSKAVTNSTSSWASPVVPDEKQPHVFDRTNVVSSIKSDDSSKSSGNKSETKSTVLADILQAAGILPGAVEEPSESVDQPQPQAGPKITDQSWEVNENSSVKSVQACEAVISIPKLIPENDGIAPKQSEIAQGESFQSADVPLESINLLPSLTTKSPDITIQDTDPDENKSKNTKSAQSSDSQLPANEQGELDPKTGVFYSNSESDGALLDSGSSMSQIGSSNNDVHDINVSKPEAELPKVQSDDQGVVAGIDDVKVVQSTVSEENIDSDPVLDKSDSAGVCDEKDTGNFSNKSTVVDGDCKEKQEDLLDAQKTPTVEDNSLDQETLMCEEVPFGDTAVHMEDMMVTIEDMASEVVETSETQIVEQNVVVEQLPLSPTIGVPPSTSDSSIVDTVNPVPTVVVNQTKSLDLQVSGSSVFMVTDSVVESESTSVQVVAVPVSEDTDSCDESSSTNLNSEQEDASGSTSLQLSVPQDEPTPAKRKRKPVTQLYSGGNLPHLSGWARSAMGLLLKVMKFRGTRRMKGEAGASHWFLQPVTDDEAPGYSQIVKFPMDFSMIKKRLETQFYEDISEFHRDMILVKHNCELYNPPDHEARLDCDEVFSFYQQEFDRLTEKWVKTHLMSPQRKKVKS